MPSYLTPVIVFKKEWPCASTRAVGQLELFVIGNPKMDFGRLGGSPSVLWAEELRYDRVLLKMALCCFTTYFFG